MTAYELIEMGWEAIAASDRCIEKAWEGMLEAEKLSAQYAATWKWRVLKRSGLLRKACAKQKWVNELLRQARERQADARRFLRMSEQES